MKTKKKALVYVLVLGIAFILIDAVLDSLLRYYGASGGFLLFNIPKYEVYGRMLLILPLVVLSIIISKFMVRGEEAEEALLKVLEEAQEQRKEISALLESTQSVLESSSFSVTAHTIFDSAKKLIGATAGYVALLSKDETKDAVLFLDYQGLPYTTPLKLPLPIDGLRAETYRTGKVLYDNEFAKSEGRQFLPEAQITLENVLFAPLLFEQKVVGLLCLANKPKGFLDQEADIVLPFAELIGIALIKKRTMESLEESEKRLTSIVQTATDAIITIDSLGNLIFKNYAAEIIFGYSSDEMLGRPSSMLVPESYRKSHQEGFSRLVSGGKSKLIGRKVELAGLRKDGSVFPVELSLAKWRYKEEIFFTGIIRDISQRKQAQDTIERLAKFPKENPNPVLRISKDGVIIYNNKASFPLLHAWGCWRGQTLPNIWQKHILEAFSSGQNQRVEVDCVDNIFSLTFAPVMDAGYVNVYALDVTERKRAEVALRESENRYRTLFNSAGDAIFIHDLKGNMLEVNHIACNHLGYSKEELLQMIPMEIETPEFAALAPQRFEEVRQHGYLVYETAHVCHDGKVIPLECNSRMVEYAGKPAMLTIARDISERKLLLEAEVVRISEARLAKAQRIAHLGNWEWDIVTDKLFWSDEVFRIFGYSPGGTEQIRELFLASIHPQDRDLLENTHNETLSKGEPYHIEYRIIRPNGEKRIIYEQGEVVLQESGKPIHLIGIAQDITERKQAEEALHESEAKLLEQKLALEQKNFALKEILEQIEMEKKKIQDDVIANVDNLLLPAVEKMKIQKGQIDQLQVEILKNNLETITSTFASKLSDNKMKLAPREIEICNLIKNGLMNKEIAELLNVSLRTVESHRKRIRRKLGISNQDVNLTVYLQALQ